MFPAQNVMCSFPARAPHSLGFGNGFRVWEWVKVTWNPMQNRFGLPLKGTAVSISSFVGSHDCLGEASNPAWP